VPLGVSRFNTEDSMRPHTEAEAVAAVDLVEEWQEVFGSALGRPLVHASDEYYLIAGRPLPSLASYGELAQHENGVGLARAFEARFHGDPAAPSGGPGGFFQSVDGAPAAGYRAERAPGQVTLRPRRDAPVTVLTGSYAAPILRPLVTAVRTDADVLVVENRYFGGNIAVAGLMAGEDVAAALTDAPPGRRYLLPDVCLSGGVFLDGLRPEHLPRPVEVVPADGAALRSALA
jgi:NifB/MoaA-like Fe-S oxidoreductase